MPNIRKRECEARVRPYINDVVAALALEGWSSDEILLAIGDVSDVLLATCLEKKAQEAVTN